ncbi:MAG: hypothetical protein ACE5H3_01905 [Planctomycetota bacterium]
MVGRFGSLLLAPALFFSLSCKLPSQTGIPTGNVLPLPGRWEPDRRLTRNAAASRTSINFARSIAADRSGRVYLVWTDERDGNPDIYFKRSPDGGTSWGPPVRLTTHPGSSLNPSIACAGEGVFVAWFDDRGGIPRVWFRRSPDSGLTWGPETLITPGARPGAFPAIAAWNASLHVVYVDGRSGDSEVWYVRSLDGGANWESAKRLSDKPHNSWTPTAAVWKEHVYVGWTDTRHGLPTSGEEEYFKRSVDNGLTWTADTRLTFDPANSWAPSLAASGSDVWFAWFDDRDGNWEIYFKRSRDFGATWSPDRRLTRDGGASVRPSLAVGDRGLHLIWWDSRDGNEEIYWRTSSDRGRTWKPPVRLTGDPAPSTLVSAAASRAGVFAVWQDERDGNPEIYFKRLPGIPVRARNGRIAFSRILNGTPQLFTALPDGSGEKQLTFPPGANEYPAWSKDGTRLAFTSTRGGAPEIWVMNPDGSGPRRLTFSGTGGSFVADWSHDGTRIAFASVRNGVKHPEIWVMSADGSNPVRLTFTPPDPSGGGGAVHPSWSPDDKKIYFASSASGSPQIWGMFADGQGQKQKTNGLGPGFPDANVPEWSSDGKRVVFWSGFEGQFGEVWSMKPNGGGLRRITETSDPRNSDNPSWSPDGRSILFDTNRTGLVEIWVVGADGSDPHRLLAGQGQTSWQPVFLPLAENEGG